MSANFVKRYHGEILVSKASIFMLLYIARISQPPPFLIHESKTQNQADKKGKYKQNRLYFFSMNFQVCSRHFIKKSSYLIIDNFP